MTEQVPSVSIIIPTHNRSASLRSTLDALCLQTYPLERVEVIVVADGCRDQTVQMLQHYEAPFTVGVIEQPSQGPAAARNNGAAKATGQFLIFLDDDIEAAPLLIEAYVHAHQSRPNQVAIGYLPPRLQEQSGFFRVALQTWWETMFRTMRQPGHRFTYSNLLSGNFSLEAKLFACVGGFDTTLWCHEDYELGFRLLKAGADFTFVAEAMGYHHEKTDLKCSLQRKFQEGRADIMLGRRHSELLTVLPLANIEVPRFSLGHLLRTLAFVQPALGDRFAAYLLRGLDILERIRLRGRWGHLLDHLLGYWYWRGVVAELGTWNALVDFLQGGPAPANGNSYELELDLREGVEVAERRLDKERPASVRIRYGQQPIGRIPPQPGAERLRSTHLRPILATDMAWSLLMALTLEQATKQGLGVDRMLAEVPVQSPEGIYAN
ncbi:MAG: glycosyltransferase family 2 protein [Chloroflexi bacterium]|nr:glycosyltransferase family 2 protein [Chloroflexota bacterium]